MTSELLDQSASGQEGSTIPDRPWPVEDRSRSKIARIDRARAEAEKFATAHSKAILEGGKLDRDRWLAPLVLAGLLGLAASLVVGGIIVAVISTPRLP